MTTGLHRDNFLLHALEREKNKISIIEEESILCVSSTVGKTLSFIVFVLGCLIECLVFCVSTETCQFVILLNIEPVMQTL